MQSPLIYPGSPIQMALASLDLQSATCAPKPFAEGCIDNNRVINVTFHSYSLLLTAPQIPYTVLVVDGFLCGNMTGRK
jgi:hypothetical protein